MTVATAPYAERRAELLARARLRGVSRRRALTDLSDEWLIATFETAAADLAGLALVAVGGYGRRELSPGSDLDVLLLHEESAAGAVAEVAERLWYPVWDSGVRLDHAVRTPAQARRLARSDLAVVLGLLDARHLAGDERLTLRLRAAVLGDWRAHAAKRLPELRTSARIRAERHGELAFLLEPDLKESHGGLRDIDCLRAVTASWLADRPHGDVDAAEARLRDVRDALHLSTGRAVDRLSLQDQDEVARRLGLADADATLATVAAAARHVAYASDETWRRVEHALRRPRRGLRGARRPGPVVRILGHDLAEHEGEVVLVRDARPGQDPTLSLRAAAAAAQAGLRLSATTATHLAEACPPLPDPWPPEALDALLSLLGAGPAAVPVWEALDQAGLVVGLLPEWALVRNRPQRNPLHRFTVDRHLVETAAAAADLSRRVRRPDLLLLAAVLHDIGKGRRRPGDHSVEGARLARTITTRFGLPAEDVDVVVRLVREHLLLLETATRRDLDDPATADTVADRVRSVDVLDLLHALTEADARATGPAAWTDWRAGLVAELVRRTRSRLTGNPPVPPAPLTPEQALLADAGELAVLLEPAGQAWDVTVVAPDRRGLFATVAGVLAVNRLSVRAATVRTVDSVAVDVWRVVPEYGEAPAVVALREDLRRALDGGYDVSAQLKRRDAARAATPRRPVTPPRAEALGDASTTATVLEVRAHDRPGLLHALGRALSLAGADIRAARVVTMGAEAVDVFYVTDGSGRPLGDARAREVARVLRDAAG